ncbi:related to polyketide synthase [Phialocephala subalpina]|uniref:Related to polyketide synthase n=1 Tax=Phialocephala subalpina TaxID=576137 RepID=A0A1L7X009_9HELO|nr:related to polyketide synthase [Phialocephala subalpina]
MTKIPPTHQQKEPIAIIGSGCRFPGSSTSPSKLWDLLKEPRDVLQKIPIERFNTKGVYNPDGMYHGSTNVTSSYLLNEDFRHFDAPFFKITPIEAHAMDPQQRLLLETVYEALESSGQSITDLKGSNTAVYVGLMSEEYGEILSRDVDYLPTYFPTATARSIMSNRISYVFDWHGPCMTIDTACSSSLVAVHQAVQTLRGGESRMAVAAGSNLCMGSKPYISENKFNMLSPRSRSSMWDSEADGYARGDGVATLVLKTLSKALEDGDHIECLIIESGVNQDGRTQGITMPSSSAQETLIRETYLKAGLDISKKSDRPQFFEAHGTGTPAGDPIEAQAIRNSFFGEGSQSENGESHDTLYVGSIKTVIGHTEGTAGIAAVMKASLGIQHGVIPPNLLFDDLSEKVAPFYGNLKIPTSAVPWPSVPVGQPRRASVNSFGFGGTNAHVILESYEMDHRNGNQAENTSPVFLPFTFSAASEKSLAGGIDAFAKYLGENKSIDLRSLADTLNFKRSSFPFRKSFSATTMDTLISKMEAVRAKPDPVATVTANPVPGKILGIFTGQGAQWPTMGRELIKNSAFARKIVEKLQAALDNLPEADQPAWSLTQELMAPASRSQMSKATISQPLCTVVQIILVDMLRLAGIQFDAVVGHSSGEMGAAYAAGYLSAEDALKIAYYRGIHSTAAASPSGAKGGMMAVGTTLEDAQDLCELEELQGRVSVAACNSQSSITLSGDIDALEEVKTALIDEGKFVRMLKVDTAYHSHHMLPCAGPYASSLEACKIQIRSPANSSCTWFSSVTEKEMSPDDPSLRSTYWTRNMTGRVNFAQAIRAALESKGPFSAATEVGPHPALRGPALQTIQDIKSASIPYSGTLERGENDLEAFANLLGFALAYIPRDILTMEKFVRTVSPDAAPNTPLKGLPSYSWEHDRVYWMETRLGRAFRTRDRPVHELLGTFSHEGSNHELRWRNVLSPNEVPWLHGHKLQGVIVFPGSGYVSMAIEAALIHAGDRSIRLLEIQDLIMGKAMVFENDRSTADVQFTLLVHGSSNDGAEASFHLEGTTNQESDELVTFCTGTLTIGYGQADTDLLPPRSSSLIDTVSVDEDFFYSCLLPIGYQYSRDFKALTEMHRTTDACTALIRQPQNNEKKSSLLVHPGVLDCAIQAVILALCSPGDNRLWSLHVPTKITRLRLNPTLLAANSTPQTLLRVDALATSLDSSVFWGDAELYAADGQLAVMQIEGVEIVPFTVGSPESDTKLFFDIRWDVASPQGDLITRGARATKKELELATLCERVAYFYLKTLMEEITEEEWSNAEWYFLQLKKFAIHCIKEVESGRRQNCEKDWKYDTRELVYAEMAKWPENIDLKLMRSVGENLCATLRRETTILEHMMHGNVLIDFYVKGLGLDKYTDFLSNAVLQLAHRHANMNILEIGAGTGGVTKTIVKQLGRTFNSYTYTDISSGFFEKAQEVFSEHSDCMIFKTLDVEKDPIAQGYQEGSYDLVVCSLVLHATENLERTLKNVRKLLKPGGYLAMLEITEMGAIRIGFSMGALPGWWLGHKDGRALNPCVPADRWDAELRKSGFSGIDAITPAVDTHAWLFSIILAQATDERVSLLQQPLAAPVQEPRPEQLTIIGGATTATSKLAESLWALLQPWFERVLRIDVVEMFDLNEIPESAIVLSLIDLDEPFFKNLTEIRFKSLRKLFEHSRNVLWVTKGARSEDPYAAMMIGFTRSLTVELPHLRLQLLEYEGSQEVNAENIAAALLRLQVTDIWERQEGGTNMLWTTEPEIAIENDQVTIPRVFANLELNNRYNSVRRPIVKSLDMSESVVRLESTESGYSGMEVSRRPLAQPSQELVTIRLSHSLPLAIQISTDSCLFLSKGIILDSGEWVIAVFSELASEVTVPLELTVPSDPPTAEDNKKLMFLGLELLARYIVGRTAPYETLLVLEASPFFAQIIAVRAAEKKVTCVFATAQPESRIPQAIYIHPQSTLRVIKSLFPASIATFADVSMGHTGVASLVASVLPQKCLKFESKELLSRTTFNRGTETTASIRILLEEAYRHVNATSVNFLDSIAATQISLPELYSLTGSNADYVDKVIDWVAPIVPVKVQPVDAKVSLQADKTYLLFGLSGQLGRSLALYMARLGAKHIVLTSRKPAVDDKWLEKARELGVEVRVVANNINDRAAVRALVDDIRETMPPIAGVANGAMVLQDTALPDMTVEIMNRVLEPKVNGSKYLDEIFQDADLDFFILLSSIATICGQHGQSNYTTANMFLNGLVAQRRRKSLAGSIMVIGAIMGIGYFSREVDDTTRDRVIQAGYRMMSERDFHLLFAEAVLAGRSNSGETYEIITGLRAIKKEEDRLAQNPIFYHVVVRQGGVLKQTSTAKVQLRTQILAATTDDEVHELIRESFLQKLQVMLQLDEVPSVDASAEELGTDSLVAVEIRSWFLNELMVDIPVLKILGGATVAAMIELAIQKFPAELTPNLKRENALPPHVVVQESPQPLESGRDQNAAVLPSSASSTRDSDDSTGDMTVPTPNTELSASLDLSVRKEVMSYGQSRFWFLGAMLEDQTAFNVVFVIQLTGEIDVGRLSWAFQKVVHRHSALRTQFVYSEEGEPMQEILAEPAFQLEHRNIYSREDVEKEFARLKVREYDLANGDLMQIALLSQNSSSHFLAVGYHHINMDSMSLQILLKDLDKAYRGLPLSAEVLQYPDHAARQRRAFHQGEMDQELAYWKNEFKDLPPVLPLLPFSKIRARQPQTSYAHNRVDAKIPQKITALVKAACAKYKISPFHFHLAVFKTLLSRFLEIDDLCIGMTNANRTELDELDSIGLYLNMLPLRFRQQADQRFAASIKEVQSKVRNALANTRLPLDVLIEQLQPERSMEYSPIFQAFIDYKPPIEAKPDLFKCTLGEEQYDVGQTAYDIMLSIVDDAKDPVVVIFQVQSSLYSEDEAEILMRSYLWLLEQFASRPESSLDNVTLHNPLDVENALEKGRGPIVKSKWPETIPHRIQQMVYAYGDSPAVIDGSEIELSYRQLDARSNTIAVSMLELGLEPGWRIATLQEPSIDWVASLLAILKVGATYVPLDLRSPVARLKAVVNDCQAKIILTHPATFKQAQMLNCPGASVVDISSWAERDHATVEVAPKANSPGYLLYTSGTTGVPKGTLLKHVGMCNPIECTAKAMEAGPGSRILQQTPSTFDLSLWETFLALATGGCLVVASSAQRADPTALVDLIVCQKATITIATPFEYTWWLQVAGNPLKRSQHWSTAMAAGEVLPATLLQTFRQLQKPHFRVFNGYGPCEASIISNMTLVDYTRENGGVPVGPAIPNAACYIVDEDLNALPVGLPGELVLSGVGIADGYINNEDQTNALFLSDPFASPEFVTKGWTKMYRTGDRGRMNSNGVVIVEGRIVGSTQVKIRGQRMELQDIEKNLVVTSGGTLTEAAVSVRGDSDRFLVAHVTFAIGETPDNPKSYLQKLVADLPVPQYMRPSLVIPLDKLPLTKHFKLDRKAIGSLPLPDTSQDEYADDNMSETEHKMRSVWQKVLPKDLANQYVLDKQSDFFHVGGNSMRLVQLQREINKVFGTRFSLPRIFENSTLGKMAGMIEPQKVEEKIKIDWVAETSLRPHAGSASTSTKRRVSSSLQTIALTGSTGFLGRTLLRQLVRDPRIAHIHCVGIRGDSSRPLPAQFSSPKVTLHYGDLVSTNLGLPQAKSDEVFGYIDAIIHNAADVSFMKTYHSLKPINLEATKEVVRLASPHRTPIHYISTAGIAHLSGLPEFPERSAAAYFPPTDGSDGYTSSKWASEVYLEKASQEFGLPVWIHRPSSIMGEDSAPTDMMANMLKFSLIMRAVPLLRGNGEKMGSESGFLDLIDVENVSSAILASLVNADSKSLVKYVHHAGEMVVPMDSVGASPGNDGEGLGFEVLTLPDWTTRARKEGLNELVAEFLRTAQDTLEDRSESLGAFLVFPRLLKGS